MRFFPDENGFSLIETIAGMMLIGIAALGLISVMDVMSKGTQTATTSAEDADLRASIVQALSDGATCVNSIQPQAALAPGIPISTNIVDASVPGTPVPVINDGQNINGVVYNVKLQYPSHFVSSFETPDGSEASFLSGNGRTDPTTRYLGEIMLTANRTSGHLGAPAVTSYIPMFFELDTTTNMIASCGTTPNDEDEPLYFPAGGIRQHTVRDCLNDGGFPYPTDIGLLCRFPVFVKNTGTASGPTPPNPHCGDTAWIPSPGWNDPPGPVAYTSTRGIDYAYTKCTNKSAWATTGYHRLGPYAIESFPFSQQSGTGTNVNWGTQAAGITIGAEALTGGGATGLGFLAISSVLGPAGLAAALIVFIIFSVTKKSCKSDPQITVYAQPIALGCY